MKSRRSVLKTIATATGSLFIPELGSSMQQDQKGIGCQHYTWHTFFRREGKQWNPADPGAPKVLKKAGYDHFEPIFNTPEDVASLSHWVNQENVKIRSFYVNSTLHEEAKAEESISLVLDIAAEAKKLGAKIVVTNPTPIRWGGEETKTDAQLRFQVKMLDRLGEKLRAMDMVLAYHTHDPEMKRGAREFHHMLVNSAPENVHICLDTHWIFRGTEDSQVALFDILKMYSDRIVELHLRQSQDGVWSESFTEGDIDYKRLASFVKKQNIQPYLVVEQAVEEGTPHTMNYQQAISISKKYVQQIF